MLSQQPRNPDSVDKNRYNGEVTKPRHAVEKSSRNPQTDIATLDFNHVKFAMIDITQTIAKNSISYISVITRTFINSTSQKSAGQKTRRFERKKCEKTTDRIKQGQRKFLKFHFITKDVVSGLQA